MPLHGGLPDSPNLTVDSSANLTGATPRVTGKRGPVAKRRFQKGCFQLKDGMAYTFYYEDRKQPDGTLRTCKVRHFIGRVPDEMSKRAADEEHARIMQAVNRERRGVAPAIKGGASKDAVESWRKDDAPDLSPSTLRQRESHLRQHILPRFANEAPHTLNVPNLKYFSRELREGGLSRKSVVQVLATVFGILAHAEKTGILVSKVSLKDLKLGREERSSAPFFTREQALQIISAAPEPYHTLFSVAFFTGCRAGEILGLQVRDLDFTRREISIRRTWMTTTAKSARSSRRRSQPLVCRCRPYWQRRYRTTSKRFGDRMTKDSCFLTQAASGRGVAITWLDTD